mgnify:CR=1 FL=1
MTAEISRKGGYSFDSGADIEAIKERNKRAKALKNAVKRYKNSGIEIPEATKIIEMAAEERVAEMSNAYDAKVLVPLQYQDTAYQNAVGDGRFNVSHAVYGYDFLPFFFLFKEITDCRILRRSVFQTSREPAAQGAAPDADKPCKLVLRNPVSGNISFRFRADTLHRDNLRRCGRGENNNLERVAQTQEGRDCYKSGQDTGFKKQSLVKAAGKELADTGLWAVGRYVLFHCDK